MASIWNLSDLRVESGQSSSNLSSCGHYQEVCEPPADVAPLPEPRRKISLTQLPYISRPQSEQDLLCGWCGFRPNFLINFRHPGYVLFVLCCMVFLQGLVANGLVYMVLPTIERRFQFRSLETGTIVSMYHLASCISAPVMTLVAAKRSKPLYLSLAAVVIAIGTLILTLPHFLVPQYRQSTYEVDLCPHKGDDPAVCSTPTGNLRSYRFVFWAGHLIVGAGSSPMYTLALTYLDENLPTTLSIKYIGQMWAKLEKKSKAASRKTKAKNAPAMGLRNFPSNLSTLLHNNTFVFLCLAGTSETMIMTGMATFMTKFFEAQLGMSSPNIAHILGCVAMPSACGGILLGGYCVYKLNLGIDGILRMCLLCSIVPWFTSFILLYSCPNPKFFGLNHTSSRFFVSTVTNQFEQDCNAYCFCPVEFYNPVCGKDNATYYSPCFAGCKRDYVYDSLKAYTDCSCIMHGGESFEVGMGAPVTVQADRKKCALECNALGLYLTGISLYMFFTFLLYTPGVSATISCVLWNSVCDQIGACAVHDNGVMSRNLFTVVLVLKTVSVLLFLNALICLKTGDSERHSHGEDSPDGETSSVNATHSVQSLHKMGVYHASSVSLY
ncbi:organic anion transporter, putative [Ixodes scapularis]|uniref:Organic anion transporter, putative n=1 Tax=Ixodes scapularis TaxID=6945 RepID=B7P3S2_IXOSC|nr:organic anion transporter, putative [Ixodes scapularis]|eukprot:XP_002404593.1 organic anion transporter, putative [Ixodes scapularis]